MAGSNLRRMLVALVCAVLLAGSAWAQDKSPQQSDKVHPEALLKVRKLIDDGHYREAEAAARTLLAETEASSGPDSPKTAEVLDLLVETLGQLWKVRDPESKVLAERALAIKEKTFGLESPEFAKSLRNLGVLVEEAGDLAGARAHFERALAIREKALGSEHPDVAESLSDLARVMKDLKVCRQYEERALAIREKVYGTDHPLVASSLNNLASVLSQMGDNAGAKTLLERALAIDEKVLGPKHPSVGKDLFRLARVLEIMDDFARSRQAIERTIAIWEETLGPEHPLFGRALNGLGTSFIFRNDFDAARKCFERSLAIADKALGHESVDVGNSLNLLGLFTDDFASARRYLERSVAVLEKAVGPDDIRVSYPLNNLANRFLDIGDYSAALKAYERVLAIREKALGPEHHMVGGILHNLGTVYMLLGDRSRARAFYERSLAIFEKTKGPYSLAVAESLGNIGDLLVESGDYAGAKPFLERSLAIVDKVLPEYDQRPLAERDLAIVLTRLGDYPAATRLIDSSLAATEKLHGPEDPLVSQILGVRAELLARQRNVQPALQAALRAEKISRDHLVLTARELPERQALTYASTRFSGVNLALSLAVEDLDRDSSALLEVWDALSRSRAVVLDEMGARNRTTGATPDSDVVALTKDLASARQHLVRLVVDGPGDDPPERYRAAVDEAREKKEKAEQVLAEKSAAFRRELARSRSGLKDVLAVLPPRSALVGFARYDRSEFVPTATGKAPESTPSYLAFVLGSGETAPHVISLGTAREIEPLVAAWREQIEQETSAEGHASKGREAKYRVSAAALRRKVWDRVAPYLRNSKRVFIVPDGALNLVNFAALPIGSASYLIEKGPVIHYLSAERDLVVTPSEPRNQGLFALGGPAFDDPGLFASLAHPQTGPAVAQATQPTAPQVYRGNRSACGSFQSMHFEALPGSRRETDQIVGLWESATLGKTVALPADATPMPGVIYLKGAAASETAFKQRAPGNRVLHLATHGFFLGGRCASALHVSDTPHDQGQSIAAENPLLLSGLVLAGANHRQAAGPDEDDGILTAEEIAAMNLEGVEWAVLSGCDTGVGEIQAGEGVFGLRRAFQIAGARSVIMSLWPVEDTTARQWMTTLYRQRFVRGLSTADSVREASLTVLRQRRARQQSTHPFYWGSFVAAGDWR